VAEWVAEWVAGGVKALNKVKFNLGLIVLELQDLPNAVASAGLLHVGVW